MATAVTVLVNTTAVDATFVAQPANFVLLDLVNDEIIWSAGSAAVADGQDTPTEAELNEAATLIDTVDVEIADAFLLDDSATGVELKLIDLAGSQDTQFVFLFSFDGATATEPFLEAWDDTNHNTTNFQSLGAGTPANSFISAVLTTSGLPGAAWTGTKIAGSSNRLSLNGGGGALVAATDVYTNIKVVVPANHPTPAAEKPVLTIRFTFN